MVGAADTVSVRVGNESREVNLSERSNVQVEGAVLPANSKAPRCIRFSPTWSCSFSGYQQLLYPVLHDLNLDGVLVRFRLLATFVSVLIISIQ